MIAQHQVDAAKASEKIVGFAFGGPLYVIYVSQPALHRAQELASAGVGPIWFLAEISRAGNSPVMTTTPEWFLELEDQIRKLRTGAQ